MIAAKGITLAGKRALVVGASRGIGRAIARQLADAGADVGVAARTVSAVKELAEEIQAGGSHALAVELDVAQIPTISSAIDGVVRRLGGLDVLVNCAGTTHAGSALELTPEAWDRVMNVNLKGLFFSCQAAGRHMKKQGMGRIVNIASATSVGAISGVAVYGASKGGVSALTRQLAVEWAGHGITVNAVAPGWTRTAFTERRFADPVWAEATVKRIPAGRAAQPEDMAGIVVFLASDSSAYVTGQTFYVDGGLTVDLTTRL